ncbi:hypothetical protein EJB05_14606, partial [Eragrostis curvula]
MGLLILLLMHGARVIYPSAMYVLQFIDSFHLVNHMPQGYTQWPRRHREGAAREHMSNEVKEQESFMAGHRAGAPGTPGVHDGRGVQGYALHASLVRCIPIEKLNKQEPARNLETSRHCPGPGRPPPNLAAASPSAKSPPPPPPSLLLLAVSPSRATSRPAAAPRARRRGLEEERIPPPRLHLAEASASTCTSTLRVRLNQAVHMLLLGTFSEGATDPFAGINNAAIVDQFYDKSNGCIVLEKL